MVCKFNKANVFGVMGLFLWNIMTRNNADSGSFVACIMNTQSLLITKEMFLKRILVPISVLNPSD